MTGIEKSAVYDVDSSDPQHKLVDRSNLSPEAISQIGELMTAFGELREAEVAMSEAAQQYMKLNATDMKAIHYLIVCKHRDVVGTPGGISEHLGVSASATTKLLGRLEHAGHISRGTHPNDRRAQAISLTPETYTTAMETVGRQQARRFHAAARLTSAEREVVIRFLRETKKDITGSAAD